MLTAVKMGIRRLVLLWCGLAFGLAVAVASAVVMSSAFVPGLSLASMPVLPFVVGLTVASMAMLSIAPLMRSVQPITGSAEAVMLAAALVFGLALRLLLLLSEPILEVDFNRYLWDGALTANGFNPYAVAPARIWDLPYNDIRLELSKAAGPVFEGISYPELKTIYPIVAQLAFAAAYLIEPWSLTAWRGVCIAADVVTVSLLVALLRRAGLSPLWAVLYWWHPLVLKEIVNSAHMEAILLPLLLGALLLAVRGWHVAAAAVLGLAIGAKLWPVMLVPLVLRPLLDRPAHLLAAVAVLALEALAVVVPIWQGGIDQTSGFVGFANHWATNSALFLMLEPLAALISGIGGPERILPGRIVRLVSAAVVLGLAIWSARTAPRDARDLLSRAYLIVSVLLLLSPAQFPWYVLWVLPIAITQARFAWLLAAALLPLYYTAFYFRAAGSSWIYESVVVWLIWGPVWLALAWEARRGRSERAMVVS